MVSWSCHIYIHTSQSSAGSSPSSGYHSKVQKLNLRGNCITEEGAIAIKQALGGASNLTCLNLSWNPLGPKGGYELCALVEVREGKKNKKRQ